KARSDNFRAWRIVSVSAVYGRRLVEGQHVLSHTSRRGGTDSLRAGRVTRTSRMVSRSATRGLETIRVIAEPHAKRSGLAIFQRWSSRSGEVQSRRDIN